jgi:hypothetical protein
MKKLKKLKKQNKKLEKLLSSFSWKDTEIKSLNETLKSLQLRIKLIANPDQVGVLGPKIDLNWVPSGTYGSYTNKSISK